MVRPTAVAARRRHSRHRFEPALKARVAELYGLDNWHGPLALLESYLWIAGAVALCLAGSWWLYPLSAVIIASRQRAFATMVHEAAHRTLARDRRLNDFLGRFPSGFLILQTLSTYHRSHVKEHHGRFGDPVADGDFLEDINGGMYTRNEAGELVPVRPSAWTLLSPLLLLQTPAYIQFLIRRRLWGRGGKQSEAVVGGLWLVALGALSVSLGVWFEVLVFWVLPFLVLFPVIGWYIELAEHFPLMTQGTDLFMSRNRHAHWIEQLFLGMHQESFHLVHHLFPRVPFWNQRRAHQVLLEDPTYAAWDRRWGGLFSSNNGNRSLMSHLLSKTSSREWFEPAHLEDAP